MPADQTARRMTLGRRPGVREAALALLVEKPRHGYGLAHEINRRLGPSQYVEPKHIYGILRQMQKEGLLSSEQQQSTGRPRKMLYATEKALEAHRQWLASRPVPSVIQTDLQMRLAFLRKKDIPGILRAFRERRIDILEEIAENAADEPLRVSCAGTGMALFRSAVDKCLKAELEWIEEATRELQQLEIRLGQ